MPAPIQDTLIPRPVSFTSTPGFFNLTAATAITVDPSTPELQSIGEYLAAHVRPATGFPLPVQASSGKPGKGQIALTTQGADETLGEEGYSLTITSDAVILSAPHPAGLFYGVQSIRQLLPPAIERPTVQPGAWQLPAGVIRDFPRFPWRGMMLDVARHFFKPADVKQVIDWLAAYKMNRLHLHLADDQGWRIQINSWPNLAAYGGSSAVNNDPAGYYTQAEYADLVAYAQKQYITIVPEIDMPGHTNAALASYAELNCNGVAPALYTGTEVGFSSLCVSKEITYKFLDDVIGELAAMTPGPYLHIGGDEASATAKADYLKFVERVLGIVQAHGKQAVGWGEISQVNLLPGTLVQYWNSDVQHGVQQGAKVIMSPASLAYLDMKYNPSTPLGLNWAGYVEVQTGYDWDPARRASGVSEKDVIGVEGPLWSETLRSLRDIEFLVFPRLPGLAEIGWTPQAGRSWDEYRLRLAAHGLRLAAEGINFYPSTQVPWPPEALP